MPTRCSLFLCPCSGPSLPPLTVQRTGDAVTVTSVGTTANVIEADVPAGDGIVHVVDAVLLPFYTTLLQVSPPLRRSLHPAPGLHRCHGQASTPVAYGTHDTPGTSSVRRRLWRATPS